MKHFTLKKVFSIKGMPESAKKYFLEKCGSPSFSGSRDCFIEIHRDLLFWKTKEELTGGKILAEREHKSFSNIFTLYIEEGVNPLADWLYQNGMTAKDETVIVEHTW